MKTKSVLVLCLMLCLGLAACATVNSWVTGVELTPAARYYDALQTFNRNVKAYTEIYNISDLATEAKYKAAIDPAVKAASLALDAWKVSLSSTTAVAAGKEQIWNDNLKNLLALLVTSGIIKVEG